MPDPIPYGRQWIDEDDIAAVADVLRSDFLTTGPAVPAFESALTEITGARHAVAVSSGTAALHAMYFAAGVDPGDEVITSPLTFAATANAALYLGATVRFADVDPNTGNIDPAAVAAQVTDRTRAIVAIDFGGQPADYDALRSAIGSRAIALLADAAHSLGATDGGRTVGTLADASALSFHPVKPITTAEGGAVLTNDRQLAGRAARFRTHGITRDPAEMQTAEEDAWCYEQHDLGFNYRLTDVQAALGRSQLRHLESFIARRREIAARYDAAFADVEGIQTPSVRVGVEPGWHLYVVLVRNAGRRRALFNRLRADGLGVQVHYVPVYWHPYYRSLGFKPGLCPVSEDRYSRAVSLPIFPRLSDDEVDSVIERVRRAASDVL